MPNLIPSELKGWDKIIDLAGVDNEPSRAKAMAEASKRQVFAVANLGENVFNAQKHISQRLDDLNEHLDMSSKSSDGLSRKMVWLTVALVVATIVQAVAAIIVAFKK